MNAWTKLGPSRAGHRRRKSPARGRAPEKRANRKAAGAFIWEVRLLVHRMVSSIAATCMISAGFRSNREPHLTRKPRSSSAAPRSSATPKAPAKAPAPAASKETAREKYARLAATNPRFKLGAEYWRDGHDRWSAAADKEVAPQQADIRDSSPIYGQYCVPCKNHTIHRLLFRGPQSAL